MGRDKALAPFLGRTLIERVIARVQPLADELLVTTNQPADYLFLGLPLFADAIPGRGALGGLYTALSYATRSLVSVVACDMPFASPALLAYQRDLLDDPELDAAVPRTEGGTEPFHAVYRRETCLPAVAGALQANKWRVDAWFAQVNIRFLSPEETARYDPKGRAFWNVNTPDELEEAEKMVGKY